MAKLHEECGVFGVCVPDPRERDAAYTAYRALYALQHRGQESAGIAVRRGGQLLLRKAPGLVPEVFDKKALSDLSGADAAIGHVRYAYDGAERDTFRAQPLLVRHAAGDMALCYNGKLVNARQLRMESETRGGIFQTGTDAEIISHIIVREHLRTNTTEDAILNAMHYMIGAYSLIVLDGKKLIAARDPNGYRPLCIGRVGGCWCAASESCAFEALGGEMVRDVEPGEVVVLTEDGPVSRNVNILARRSSVEADIVVGVPDSGLSAAQGFAEASGIPYAMGLMKNRYIPRTFIQPTQGQREQSVRIKLNAMGSTVRGKRVILVDDSIVRGTTSARLVKLLRDSGAAEVHFKVSAPPFLNPCYFGTSLPDCRELAAHGRTEEEVCSLIGADSLQYLTVEDMRAAASGLRWGHCDACFTGDYAVPVPHGH